MDRKPPLILFDGICTLCNGFVQFILRHEKDPTIHFAPLQSELGEQICMQLYAKHSLHTLIFYEEGKVLERSDAALAAMSYLKAPYRWLFIFKVLPRWLRNWIYDLVAANRYNVFGKRPSCMVPAPEWKHRFHQMRSREQIAARLS